MFVGNFHFILEILTKNEADFNVHLSRLSLTKDVRVQVQFSATPVAPTRVGAHTGRLSADLSREADENRPARPL